MPTYLPISFCRLSKLLLGGEKLAGDLVFKKRLARGFELADLRGTELDAGVLLLVQFLAALMHALVLKAGGIVAQETFDVALKLEKCRDRWRSGRTVPGFLR